MTDVIHAHMMDNAVRLGKLLGCIGAMLKYDGGSDLSNYDFKRLALTYIECSIDEQDIAMVMAQAQKRGVDLT